MKYLHGIRLDFSDKHHMVNAHNIALTERIRSKAIYGMSHLDNNPRYMPIRELREKGISGFVSPCDICINQASEIRKWMKENNITEEKLNGAQKRILKRCEDELFFEEVRRGVSPDSASRLSCVFLGEDSPKSRKMVKRMKGDDALILEVDIEEEIRLTKADAKWYDVYCDDPKPEYVEKYWRGIPCGEKPEWEYLLEGSAKLTQTKQLAILNAHNSKFGINIKIPPKKVI